MTLPKNAASMAIAIGILLIIVGVLSRLLTGTSSITALIPAFFGLPIMALGAVALTPQRWRGSTIGVSVLSLLGVIGTYTVVIDLFGALRGSEMSASTVARALMFILCLILLIVCGVALTRERRNQSS